MQDKMCMSRDEIIISGGDAKHQWICEDPGLTSRSDQPLVALDLPQRRLSANILTPKDGVSFFLVILTKGRHQVGFRSLRGPCFVVKILLNMKYGDQCLTYT